VKSLLVDATNDDRLASTTLPKAASGAMRECRRLLVELQARTEEENTEDLFGYYKSIDAVLDEALHRAERSEDGDEPWHRFARELQDLRRHLRAQGRTTGDNRRTVD
jgi:hypothetical protein